MKVIELNKKASDSNDRDAEILRGELKARGIFLVNLMSGPGAGKTTLISRTIRDLSDRLSIGVMEADIDSSVDAETIERLGARSIQVHTGGNCHMDATMTRESLEEFDPSGLDLIFLENVGNLICPAEYDSGAHLKVMILSVPEGDDKPLKYPLMFRESDALLITKTDVLPFFDFDLDEAVKRAKALNPNIRIFPVSAKTGEGMSLWEDWLMSEIHDL